MRSLRNNKQRNAFLIAVAEATERQSSLEYCPDQPPELLASCYTITHATTAVVSHAGGAFCQSP